MKIMGKFRTWLNNMQIKNKLMWMYVGAILLPIFILFIGFIVSLVCETHVREELAKEAASERIITNVYGLFEDMNQVGIYFSADTELYQMFTDYDSTDYFDALIAARNIDNRISIINWAFPKVHRITLYHNNEELMNSDQLNYLDDEDRNTNWYKEFSTSNADFYYSAGSYENEMYLSLTNRVSAYFSNGDILVHQEIGQEELTSALQDTYFYDKSRVFLLNPKNEIIGTNDNVYSNVNEIQLFDKSLIPNGSEVQYMPFEYKNYTNGWQVVFLIDQPGLINAFTANIGVFLIIMVFIFIGSFALVQIVSSSIRNRLSGISKVMEVSQSGALIEAGEDSSKDEIGIVVQSYNRMVQRIEMLLYEIRVSRDESDILLRQKVEAYDELEIINEELANLNNELTNSLEENRVQNAKINELIYKDMLTGLYNRFSVTNIIDKGITPGLLDFQAVIFIDVDNFKFINDTYGHDTGDLVIKATGNKLKAFESEQITIGRFGGDEFLIFINMVKSRIEVVDFLEAIRMAFKNPVMLEDKRFYLTISMGVAICPEHGVSRNELIKKADMALYKSKDTGRNRYTFYDALFDEDLERKINLQNAIKYAALNDEFYLNYQPYVESSTGKLMGYEALIRWYSKELGQVSPYELVTIAEEMGLIVEIGDWIIEEALNFIKNINQNRTDKLTISINISVVQLRSKDFATRLMGITKAVGVSPGEICLEMTETVLIDSFTRSGNDLRMLNELGFGIALDDFGTGYSSLSYLKELPVTVLKIDKSFVDELTTSEFNRELVNVMVSIAHSKGIKVTAEGVETLQQFEILRMLNCDIIQGYYFSKPLDTLKAAAYQGAIDLLE